MSVQMCNDISDNEKKSVAVVHEDQSKPAKSLEEDGVQEVKGGKEPVSVRKEVTEDNNEDKTTDEESKGDVEREKLRRESENSNEEDQKGYNNGEGSKPRRRIGSACMLCRRKKIKCDSLQPQCTNCKNRGAHCIYAKEKKRGRPPRTYTFADLIPPGKIMGPEFREAIEEAVIAAGAAKGGIAESSPVGREFKPFDFSFANGQASSASSSVLAKGESKDDIMRIDDSKSDRAMFGGKKKGFTSGMRFDTRETDGLTMSPMSDRTELSEKMLEPTTLRRNDESSGANKKSFGGLDSPEMYKKSLYHRRGGGTKNYHGDGIPAIDHTQVTSRFIEHFIPMMPIMSKQDLLAKISEKKIYPPLWLAINGFGSKNRAVGIKHIRLGYSLLSDGRDESNGQYMNLELVLYKTQAIFMFSMFYYLLGSYRRSSTLLREATFIMNRENFFILDFISKYFSQRLNKEKAKSANENVKLAGYLSEENMYESIRRICWAAYIMDKRLALVTGDQILVPIDSLRIKYPEFREGWEFTQKSSRGHRFGVSSTGEGVNFMADSPERAFDEDVYINTPEKGKYSINSGVADSVRPRSILIEYINMSQKVEHLLVNLKSIKNKTCPPAPMPDSRNKSVDGNDINAYTPYFNLTDNEIHGIDSRSKNVDKKGSCSGKSVTLHRQSGAGIGNNNDDSSISSSNAGDLKSGLKYPDIAKRSAEYSYGVYGENGPIFEGSSSAFKTIPGKNERAVYREKFENEYRSFVEFEEGMGRQNHGSTYQWKMGGIQENPEMQGNNAAEFCVKILKMEAPIYNTSSFVFSEVTKVDINHLLNFSGDLGRKWFGEAVEDMYMGAKYGFYPFDKKMSQLEAEAEIAMGLRSEPYSMNSDNYIKIQKKAMDLISVLIGGSFVELFVGERIRATPLLPSIISVVTLHEYIKNMLEKTKSGRYIGSGFEKTKEMISVFSSRGRRSFDEYPEGYKENDLVDESERVFSYKERKKGLGSELGIGLEPGSGSILGSVSGSGSRPGSRSGSGFHTYSSDSNATDMGVSAKLGGWGLIPSLGVVKSWKECTKTAMDVAEECLRFSRSLTFNSILSMNLDISKNKTRINSFEQFIKTISRMLQNSVCIKSTLIGAVRILILNLWLYPRWEALYRKLAGVHRIRIGEFSRAALFKREIRVQDSSSSSRNVSVWYVKSISEKNGGYNKQANTSRTSEMIAPPYSLYKILQSLASILTVLSSLSHYWGIDSEIQKIENVIFKIQGSHSSPFKSPDVYDTQSTESIFHHFVISGLKSSNVPNSRDFSNSYSTGKPRLINRGRYDHYHPNIDTKYFYDNKRRKGGQDYYSHGNMQHPKEYVDSYLYNTDEHSGEVMSSTKSGKSYSGTHDINNSLSINTNISADTRRYVGMSSTGSMRQQSPTENPNSASASRLLSMRDSFLSTLILREDGRTKSSESPHITSRVRSGNNIQSTMQTQTQTPASIHSYSNSRPNRPPNAYSRAYDSSFGHTNPIFRYNQNFNYVKGSYVKPKTMDLAYYKSIPTKKPQESSASSWKRSPPILESDFYNANHILSTNALASTNNYSHSRRNSQVVDNISPTVQQAIEQFKSARDSNYNRAGFPPSQKSNRLPESSSSAYADYRYHPYPYSSLSAGFGSSITELSTIKNMQVSASNTSRMVSIDDLQLIRMDESSRNSKPRSYDHNDNVSDPHIHPHTQSHYPPTNNPDPPFPTNIVERLNSSNSNHGDNYSLNNIDTSASDIPTNVPPGAISTHSFDGHSHSHSHSGNHSRSHNHNRGHSHGQAHGSGNSSKNRNSTIVSSIPTDRHINTKNHRGHNDEDGCEDGDDDDEYIDGMDGTSPDNDYDNHYSSARQENEYHNAEYNYALEHDEHRTNYHNGGNIESQNHKTILPTFRSLGL